TAQGRWDMLLASDGGRLTLGRDGRVQREDGRAAGADFLDALDAERAVTPRPDGPSPWPFSGGWALFLGYELAAQVEPVLALPPAQGALPVAAACRCPVAVLRDRNDGGMVAVAEAGAEALL